MAPLNQLIKASNWLSLTQKTLASYENVGYSETGTTFAGITGYETYDRHTQSGKELKAVA